MGVLFAVNIEHMFIVLKWSNTTLDNAFLLFASFIRQINVNSVQRSFRREFEVRDGPSRQEIMDLIEKFEETSSVADA